MKRFLIVLAVWGCAALPTTASRAQEALSLTTALHRALESNPELIASRQRLRAAHARAEDAGKWTNPSLDLSVENFGGALGADRIESTLELGQLIELGGDRSARAGVSRTLTEIARTETASLEREVLRETAERFLDAWSMQERTKRLAVSEQNAIAAVDAAENRLRAGAAPRHEMVRAQGYRSLRMVERTRAIAELATLRRKLAIQWAASGMTDSLVLAAPDTTWIPDPAALVDSTKNHPAVRRAAAEITLEDWRLREARASRIPDLTLSAGVRHLSETDGTGFIGAISVPLPFWNRLSGAITAAGLERSAAQERLRLAGLRIDQELRAAVQRYDSAVDAWRGIQNEVLPASREALALVQNAYQSGRLTYVEILDTQRNLLEVELAAIEAATDLWRAGITLSLLLTDPSPTSNYGGRAR